MKMKHVISVVFVDINRKCQDNKYHTGRYEVVLRRDRCCIQFSQLLNFICTKRTDKDESLRLRFSSFESLDGGRTQGVGSQRPCESDDGFQNGKEGAGQREFEETECGEGGRERERERERERF